MMASASQQEKILFLKLAEGDEMVFRQVFDEWGPSFHAAAYKITRSADLAEEIVQEVFTTLWEKRVQVAAAHNPKGYLIAIIHNLVYAHFRGLMMESRARQMAFHNEPELENNPVEELLLAKENQQVLHEVISKLSPQQQLVYRLAKQEGLSREEIAQKLNISPNTVRNHLATAVEHIRKYFRKGASALVWLLLTEHL